MANKPIPVRSGVVPSATGGRAPPTQPSLATLREIKSNILQNEIRGGVPGAAAAARLGTGTVAPSKGKKVIMQQTIIPGLDIADPPNSKATKQENRLFNLHEEGTAFPSLNGNTAAIKPTPGQANGVCARSHPINAVHKSDSTGFITDLSRYNALLNGGGNNSDGDCDLEESFGAGGSQMSGPASQADFEVTDIDDQVLMTAIHFGLEEAGLDERYEDYINNVRKDFLEAIRIEEALAKDERRREEAARDHAEAERIVMEAEWAEAEAAAAEKV